MKVKLNLKGIHEGQPMDVNLEMDMTPQEMISYVKEIAPVVKSALKVQKQTNAIATAALKFQKKQQKDKTC